MGFMNRVKFHLDRVGAVALAMIGVVVLIIGWHGVASSGYAAEQLPYIISAGIGGLFLLGTAGTLWLSADLRDEWYKLDGIERAVRELGGGAHHELNGAAGPLTPEPQVESKSGRTRTSTRRHRPDPIGVQDAGTPDG